MTNIINSVKTEAAIVKDEGVIWTGVDNLDILKQLPDGCVDAIYQDILYFTNKVWTKNDWTFDDRFDSMWDFLFFNAERIVEEKRIMRTRRYQLVDGILLEDGEECIYLPRKDKILADHKSKAKLKKLEGGVDVGASIFTHCDYRTNSEMKTYILDPLFGEGKTALEWGEVQALFKIKLGKKVHTPVSVPKVTISQGPDIVLDPYGGSHSTAAAAYKLGRRFISLEINKSEQLFLDMIKGVDFGQERKY